LSRRASLCTDASIAYYRDTAGGFVRWAIAQGIEGPTAISGQQVRAYIASVAARGVSDGTVHAHARATKTFLRFLAMEGYRKEAVPVTLPKVAAKRLPVLTPEQVRAVLGACRTARDTALVLLLVDTGLRRAEALSLTWGDVDLESGIVRLRSGKGRKARTVVAGVTCRRGLLRYRWTG